MIPATKCLPARMKTRTRGIVAVTTPAMIIESSLKYDAFTSWRATGRVGLSEPSAMYGQKTWSTIPRR